MRSDPEPDPPDPDLTHALDELARMPGLTRDAELARLDQLRRCLDLAARTGAIDTALLNYTAAVTRLTRVILRHLAHDTDASLADILDAITRDAEAALCSPADSE